MTQKTLTGKSHVSENRVLVYSKQVKGRTVSSSSITSSETKKNLINLVHLLLQLGETRHIDELNLKENCIELITSIFSSFPVVDNKDVRLLLYDFTDSMRTSMRKEEKHVVAIISEEGLFLCHSKFGEQTITPDWEIVKRMMDKDNVIRFVNFSRGKNKINVTYYEEYPSESFVNWLELPEKVAFFYLGGKNRFYTELEGLRCALELTDEDVEEKFIEETLEIKDNQIILSNPIYQIPLTQIRVGKKRYNNINDFIQDFFAKRYDINYYQEKYSELRGSQLPYSHKCIDQKDSVIYFEKGESKIYLRKRNPNFHIIFADEFIEIRESFLGEIVTKLINSQELKLLHAGCKYSSDPLKLGSLEIFNILNCGEVTNSLIKWYEKTNLRDVSLDRIIFSAIMSMIIKENSEKQIVHFLRKIVDNVTETIVSSQKFIELETDLIEFKSRSYFEGKNEGIIERFTEDIKSKLSEFEYKIYLIGADEQTHDLEPISANRTKDDRLHSIQEKIKRNLKLKETSLIKIPLSDAQKCILMLIVGRNHE